MITLTNHDSSESWFACHHLAIGKGDQVPRRIRGQVEQKAVPHRIQKIGGSSTGNHGFYHEILLDVLQIVP